VITTDLNLVKKELIKGEPVAIPTETVYGLAANAFKATSVDKIFHLKQRPANNPLIVHIPSSEFLSKIACEIPESAKRLATAFWPGPLTLVLKKQKVIPDRVTAGKDTVGVRIPKHTLTLKLLKQLDFPLAAPSANPFGAISPTTAVHVSHAFQDKLKYVLDGGPCERGLESTIIGFENDQAVLYRHGAISLEAIEEIVGKIHVKNKNEESPEAPGMLSKHYAPKTPIVLSTEIAKDVKTYRLKKLGLLFFKDAQGFDKLHQVKVLSPKGDLKEAAKKLYTALHHLDQLDLDLIITEHFPENDLGRTINDRLKRAVKK
jgi:L-threonylcarbamoyladenylate synthase